VKILLDLNHPSHIHFFRQFIVTGREKGLQMTVTVRNRKYMTELMEYYNIPFIKKGKRARTVTGKLWVLKKEIVQLFLLGKSARPDVFVSFASPYAAVAGKLLGKPVITFDDTECDRLLHMVYPRFSDIILTPECFQKSFGKKQIRFRGYKELSYLQNSSGDAGHPKLIEKPVSKENERIILVRFVSRAATHELYRKGLSTRDKLKIITKMLQSGRVVISSEASLPGILRKYSSDVPEGQMHEFMQQASLVIGDSPTMAMEAAILGTQSILIDNRGRGYIDDLAKKTDLVRRYPVHKLEEALEDAADCFTKKQPPAHKFTGAWNNVTDITKLLIWLVEEPTHRMEELKNNQQLISKFTIIDG
jgi:hypothetical protein